MNFLIALEENTNGSIRTEKCLTGDGPIAIEDMRWPQGSRRICQEETGSSSVTTINESTQDLEDFQNLAGEDFLALTLDSQLCVCPQNSCKSWRLIRVEASIQMIMATMIMVDHVYIVCGLAATSMLLYKNSRAAVEWGFLHVFAHLNFEALGGHLRALAIPIYIFYMTFPRRSKA